MPTHDLNPSRRRKPRRPNKAKRKEHEKLSRMLCGWLFDHLAKLEPTIAVDEVLAQHVKFARRELLNGKSLFIGALCPTTIFSWIHWNALQQDGLPKYGVPLIKFLMLLCVRIRESGERRISPYEAIQLMLPFQERRNEYLGIICDGDRWSVETTRAGERRFGKSIRLPLPGSPPDEDYEARCCCCDDEE